MFNVTDEMKKSLLDKINDCNGYVERQITPPKPENITNKICAYCSYKNTCKKEM
jgi:CRISPR/Cas system-associated exonuclease Cas4 (RecB family)